MQMKAQLALQQNITGEVFKSFMSQLQNIPETTLLITKIGLLHKNTNPTTLNAIVQNPLIQ